MEDKIEILPVSLLDQYQDLVCYLKKLASSLRLEFGWHYLLDLTWIISRLDISKNLQITDAGAGTGILQWYLAEQGASVLSVDRESRANLPLRFRFRYSGKGKNKEADERINDLSDELELEKGLREEMKIEADTVKTQMEEAL